MKGTINILQVCSSANKEGLYGVLSLDYGFERKVKLSQIYQPCQTLIHIMPSVTLFTIRGKYIYTVPSGDISSFPLFQELYLI